MHLLKCSQIQKDKIRKIFKDKIRDEISTTKWSGALWEPQQAKRGFREITLCQISHIHCICMGESVLYLLYLIFRISICNNIVFGALWEPQQTKRAFVKSPFVKYLWYLPLAWTTPKTDYKYSPAIYLKSIYAIKYNFEYIHLVCF